MRGKQEGLLVGGFLWAELRVGGILRGGDRLPGAELLVGGPPRGLPAKLAWPAWAADSDWMVPGPRIMFYMLNRFHKIYEV